MSKTKKIIIQQNNGRNYDTLYPKITPEQVGAVSYEAQTLTYTQKTQARDNINAAPGGFGLGGEAKVLTPADNLNDVWQAGWYAWDAAPQNAPTVGGSLIPYCSMTVMNKGSNYNLHQIARTFEGYEIHRYCDGSKQTWSEWAWVNPPMRVGVEYRTTEQYLEKPVYVKLVDCGTIPAQGTYKQFTLPSDVDVIISINAYSPMRGDTLPSYDANGERYAITSTGGNIVMIWNYSESLLDTNVLALIKYTKTTN